MTLRNPYYTLAVSMKNNLDKSATKSIAAINLPDLSTSEIRDAVAVDLYNIGGLVSEIIGNVFVGVTLTTREEVQ